MPNWIGLVLGRRHEREKRAAVQVVERRAQESHGELPVVPSRGDLICFNAAIHPC